MRRWWIILAGSIGVILLGTLALVEGAYRSGLSILAALPVPPSTDGLSEAAKSLAWLDFEGVGPIVVEPTGPLNYVARIVSASSRGRNDPLTTGGLKIAGFCARHVITEQNPDGLRQVEFSLGMASVAIWLSRNRTTDQIIACALNGGYYGHGFTGIEAAASGYFGKPAIDLSYDEAAALIVALRAPSRFDPICSPSKVRSEAAVLIARMVAPTGLDGSRRELISGPTSEFGLDTDERCASEDPPDR